MESDHGPLEALGLALGGPASRQHLGSLRIVRSLLDLPARRIGLLPVGDDRGVGELAVRLALAAAELGRGPVAAADLAGTWTKALAAWPAVPVDEGAPWGLLARTLRPGCELWSPPDRARAGVALLDDLRAAVRQARAVDTLLFVGLAELRARGEHLTAMEALDGVALVASAGRTNEAELIAAAAELGAHPQLGVILVEET